MTALYLLSVPAFLLAFFYLYVLTMGFYRASLAGRLNGVVKWLAYPLVLLAIAVDLMANWTIAALWFWQWPLIKITGWRPDMVTDRLSRYINGPDGWRKAHATWLCVSLLDCFDPSGKHCK